MLPLLLLLATTAMQQASACAANWTANRDVDCCNLHQQGPTTRAECCELCTRNPKCAAAVWNAGSNRWYNLKWSAAAHHRSTSKGEELAVIRAPSGPPPPPPPLLPTPPPASLPDWLARYNAGHLLYADAAAVALPKQQHLMPEVGNGFVGVQAHGRPSIVGDYLMIGGVYNGRTDTSPKLNMDGPSHRAEIPFFLPSIAAPAATPAEVQAHAALDLQLAAFITRGALPGGVAVEQRRYAHWTRPHLLVQEFHLSRTTTHDSQNRSTPEAAAAVTVSFTTPNEDALWSSGIDFIGSTLAPPKPGVRIVEG